MQATYVDVNEFTVATDRTAEFINGRRIKADCDTDGIKYCTVLSSSYGDPNTTVITKESELTANLDTVLYGIVEPKTSGSLPDHSHDGLEGSGGSALGTSGDVTFNQSIIVDEIRSDKAGGLRLGGYDVTYTDIDFTNPAWTEEDPGDDIVVTASKVAWTALPRNLDSYVYYDYGANYFDGDFRHEFECELTAADDGGIVYPWALANAVDDFKDIDDAAGSFLNVLTYRNGAVYSIFLTECDSGSVHQVGSVISTGTIYYITVVRNESVGAHGTLYCYIYTDVARTVLHEKLELTLHSSKKDFRYLYDCNTYNDAEALTITGFIQNLRLSTDPFGIEKGIYVHDGGHVDMHMQSSCRIKLSVDQQLVAGTYHLLQLDTEHYDIQNEWNAATYRFTVTKAGIYLVCASVYFLDTAAGDFIRLLIYVNGVGIAKAYETIDDNQCLVLSMGFDLDVNDYIEIHVRDDETAAKAYAGHSMVSIQKIA